MPVAITCETCGKSKVVPPSQAHRRYCSRACYVSTIANRVDRICMQCGRQFDVQGSSVKYHGAKYCSAECKHEGRKTDPRKTVLSRIDRSAGPDACWPYTGSRLPKGYGSHRALGRHWYAHRVAFEAANGPIPEGMHVCHRCDNPPCCNPAHLFLGTHAENHRDKVAKSRQARGNKGTGKLANAQVLAIRALNGQRSAAKVAEQFGVSRSVIQRVWSGESYAHVVSPPRQEQVRPG